MLCPEVLFQPTLIGKEANGIHTMIFKSVTACNVDFHNELYANVVLSGGSTMFPGMPEHMTLELTSLTPPKTKVMVFAPPERKYSVWIGGSKLASSSKFNLWVTKKEYDEFGLSSIHRKFF